LGRAATACSTARARLNQSLKLLISRHFSQPERNLRAQIQKKIKIIRYVRERTEPFIVCV